MEFCAYRSDLLKELELLQGAVERKSTVPILAHALLEFEGLSLKLSATDLELGARSSCPAKVKTPGAAAVPARRLLEIVRSLPDAEIRFKFLENHWAQVSCERASFKLVGMAKESFPALPAVPKLETKLPGDVLAGLIERTGFAISSEESRFTLNGALLLIKPDRVAMVATDGHRLAQAERRLDGAAVNPDTRLLIPKKALGQLSELLAKAPAEVTVGIAASEQHLFFLVGERLLISRMMNGQFPNYEAVLPRDNNKVLELDKDQVSAAVRRVSLLASEQSRAVRLQLDQEQLEVAASGDQGEATEVLEAKNGYESVRIAFNHVYLTGFFDVVGKGGRVSLALKDEQSAVELRPVDGEPYEYRYVVMPLRA